MLRVSSCFQVCWNKTLALLIVEMKSLGQTPMNLFKSNYFKGLAENLCLYGGGFCFQSPLSVGHTSAVVATSAAKSKRHHCHTIKPKEYLKEQKVFLVNLSSQVASLGITTRPAVIPTARIATKPF